METITTVLPSERVLAAHQHLAADDEDFATERNHVGYNKADTYVGHDLSELPEIAGEDLLFAWHLAKTYTRQLDAAGIELPTYREVADELGLELTEAEYEAKRALLNTARRAAAKDRKAKDRQAEREKLEGERKAAKEAAARKRAAGRIEIDGARGLVRTTTAYDAALVERMRGIQGRRWVAGDMNTFPLAAYAEVRAMLPNAEVIGEPPAPGAPRPARPIATHAPAPTTAGYIRSTPHGVIVSFGGYDAAKVHAIKQAIPPSDRSWDGARTEWKVSPEHLETVLALFPALARQ